MLENVLFFLLIFQKSPWAQGALSSDFWLKLHFIIQLFLLVGMQGGLVLSPGAGHPRYATDIHALVYERYVII